VDQAEQYFLVELGEVAPAVCNSSSEPILEHRWWRVAELRDSTETIYPEGLANRLAALTGAANEKTMR